MDQARNRATQWECHEREHGGRHAECVRFDDSPLLVSLRVRDIIELLERGSMSSEAMERLANSILARDRESLENERRRMLAYEYLLQKSNALKDAHERACYLEQQRRAREFVYDVECSSIRR